MMRLKSFVSGLVSGIVIASAVGVYAANTKVEVWVTDGFKLNIDGKDRTLPSDYHILNYQDRIYLPFRYVAEELGATVAFYADTNRVMVESPEPKVIEKIVQVEKETKPEISYLDLPIRLKQKGITINIYEVTRGAEDTYVSLDVQNENTGDIQLDFKNARFDIDGVSIASRSEQDYAWQNPVPSYSSLDDKELVFASIPSQRDKVKLIIPVLTDEFVTDKNGYDLITNDFTFYIDLTERND